MFLFYIDSFEYHKGIQLENDYSNNTNNNKNIK